VAPGEPARDLEQCRPIRSIRHVGRRLAAGGTNLLGCRRAGRGIYIDQADGHTVLCQPHGHRTTQTSSGTGDEDGLFSKLGNR
ncbi:MAG TPA: hypothetical protein VI199_11035, partial [Novosphingobium sp.]